VSHRRRVYGPAWQSQHEARCLPPSHLLVQVAQSSRASEPDRAPHIQLAKPRRGGAEWLPISRTSQQRGDIFAPQVMFSRSKRKSSGSQLSRPAEHSSAVRRSNPMDRILSSPLEGSDFYEAEKRGDGRSLDRQVRRGVRRFSLQRWRCRLIKPDDSSVVRCR